MITYTLNNRNKRGSQGQDLVNFMYAAENF